jgi:hypothetical protein
MPSGRPACLSSSALKRLGLRSRSLGLRNEPLHLDFLEQACEGFIFVQKDGGRVSQLQRAGSMRELLSMPGVATNLGSLADGRG